MICSKTLNCQRNEIRVAHIEILSENPFLAIIQWEAYDGRF